MPAEAGAIGARGTGERARSADSWAFQQIVSKRKKDGSLRQWKRFRGSFRRSIAAIKN